jgi:ribosomal protein L11 methyltransferase
MTERTWPVLEMKRLQPVPPDGPDLLPAALVDYRVVAIDETVPDVWQVFFSSDAERDRAAVGLASQFPDLALSSLDVPDQDWVAKSQADLRAVRVGNIVVAPPWDMPHTGKLRLDLEAGIGGTPLTRPVIIVIRPSMGFGTGHHATTRICLAALQHLDVRGRSAIDIGTGSGVLAVAASRLGATPVVGIDDDPNALHAAEESLSLNRAADVSLRAADLRATGSDTFDLVIANLTGALLVEATERLCDLAVQGGRLILSGFIRHEEEAVRIAYSGLAVTNRVEEDGWVCLALQRP